MSYKFQFTNVAGFHAVNYSTFQLAHGYRDRGMEACAALRGSTEREQFH
jgi:isocitrate lyase